MKTGKMIRWTLLLVSTCISLWQAPAIIHALDSAKAASGGPGGFQGVRGIPDLKQLTGQTGIPSLPGMPSLPALQAGANAQASQQNLAALQAALAGSAAKQKSASKDPKKAEDDLVIFSPDGKQLTEAERQKLLREAARNRPAPRADAPSNGK